MRTYFTIEVADWWHDTYENLNRRFGASRLVLPGPPPANRKWKNMLGILGYQGVQVWPIMRAIFKNRDQVLVVCTTAHYAALLCGLLAPYLGRKPRIYLLNFYLHSLGDSRLVRQVLARLLAQEAGVLVQSPNEIAFFQELAPRLTVDYYPLCLGYPAEPLGDTEPDDYVFAGGSTNRDFDALVKVALRQPALRFVIVRSASNVIAEPIPGNVELLTDIPADRFRALVGKSKAVVIPLKRDVGSSGQMVTLLAMQMSKPVIYADYPVVSQYFIDGYSGIAYQPRDEFDLESKLVALLGDPELLRRLGAQARQEWETRFVRDRYEQAVMESIERFVGLSGTRVQPSRPLRPGSEGGKQDDQFRVLPNTQDRPGG